jgi:hypothetical protein
MPIEFNSVAPWSVDNRLDHEHGQDVARSMDDSLQESNLVASLLGLSLLLFGTNRYWSSEMQKTSEYVFVV